MERRKVLIGGGLLVAGALLPKNQTQAKEATPELPAALAGSVSKVSGAWIQRGQESPHWIDKILTHSSDFAWLKPGDSVLIKLALNSGNPFPATSDPWVLRNLIRHLKAKGAGRVLVGDQSGIASVDWRNPLEKKGSSRQLCESAGLLQAIVEEGAEPHFFEEKGYQGYFQATPRGQHHWQKLPWITTLVREVDHIIYNPRVGSHMLGEITAGLKLSVGFLREDSRGVLHQGGEHFNAMYEEINRIPEIEQKLRLVVTSGRKVLSTMGPDRGNITEPEQGLIFASQDLVGAELVAYAWLEWNRLRETSWLGKATLGSVTHLRSFGNRQFVNLMWDGDAEDIPGFVPGSIFLHPALLNAYQDQGGRPEEVQLTLLNSGPPQALEFMLSALFPAGRLLTAK